MPRVDKRTGDIVIRIVYDGSPEAGKTTNLAELAKAVPMRRRSQLVSPETTSRRTEFFDWVTLAGGYVNGRQVRCQLVSVPGQSSLLRRRSYLIDSADAVVFIADSRPMALEENRRSFDLMRRAVMRRGGVVPADILLQANKQDLDGALEPAELARAMSVGPDVVVRGAVAVRGEGVMRTFLDAARLGTARVKELLKTAGWAEIAGQASSPEELLSELQKLGEELDASATSLDAGEPLFRPRSKPRLPEADDLSSGHFWPLNAGRETFAEALEGRGYFVEEPSPCAPEHAAEVRVEADGAVRWILHTCDAWSFEKVLPAKMALIALIRRLRVLDPFLVPGRALWLHDDGESMRIWMASAAVPSLRDALHQRSANAAASDTLIAGLREAMRLSSSLEDIRIGGACLDGIGTLDGRAFVLGIPTDGGSRLGSLTDELRALGADHAEVLRQLEVSS